MANSHKNVAAADAHAPAAHKTSHEDGGTDEIAVTGLVGLPTRATLGLDTTDSPQLAAINLGHASDTTIARASAGNVTVEGNALYRAGGTDVAVADGGTGASTAAGGATALGVGTGDSPQFTGINLGHASDTTLTRVSAGVIAVEGQTVLTGAGAALILLEQHTASTSASLDFTTFYSATYDEYLVEMLNLVPATDAVDLRLRMSTDGGSSYDAGANYGSVGAYFYTGGTGVITSNDVGTEITMIDTVDNSANYGVCGSFRLYSPGSTALYKLVVGEAMMFHGTLSKILGDKFAGVYRSTTAVNAFRVLFSSGNIASGIVRVYGIAK